MFYYNNILLLLFIYLLFQKERAIHLFINTNDSMKSSNTNFLYFSQFSKNYANTNLSH
jgi:hypothetical protein